MANLIGRLLGKFTGAEWRLYLVKRSVGLVYALHNKGGLEILGYLQAEFEAGARVSDDWKLYLGYYTFTREHCFQLTEAMFTNSRQFNALMDTCLNLDKGRIAGWNPYFVHVPTRRRLPLDFSVHTDQSDISYIPKKTKEALSENDEGVTFSKVSAEVFVRIEPPPVRPVGGLEAENTLLRQAGWSDEDIADMSPPQRAAELKQAGYWLG